VLTTIGMTKNSLGDASGVQDMERALELALEIDSPVAGPIVNNLAVEAFFAGDLERTSALYAESIRLSRRLGDEEGARFTESNEIWIDYFLGRWDDALQRAGDFVAACEGGALHANEFAMRLIRGSIRLARGDSGGALADHRRSVELARAVNDPSDVTAALSTLATTHAYRGEVEEARALVEELTEVIRRTSGARIFELAALAGELGIRDVLSEALAANELTRRVIWREAQWAALSGDLLAAAEIGATTGNVTLEALMRFHAGTELVGQGRQAEGEAQLRRALDFYRSVGGAFFLERGEALLAQTA
jgi:tetratricopeptide (TPR) repeat protein